MKQVGRNPISKLMVVALLGLLVSAAVAAVADNKAGQKAAARTLPEFSYTQGWLGADDAYSIALDATHSIWLFGDTFVADPDTSVRSKAKAMARNSVGISTCDAGKPCTMKYYWRGAGTAAPRSFFDTGNDNLWYWPLDGYLDGDTLYVSMMTVRNKQGAGPEDPFGFEIAGTRWFIIHNATAPPDEWKMDSKVLTTGNVWAGNSIFAGGTHVLMYAQVSQGDGKGFMTVLRVPKTKLADPAKSWEYYGDDKKWHEGLPGSDAMHVIEQAIAEMSVRYHPSIKKWVAISGGKEWPTKRIVARLADSPVGPWSEPKTIFDFPEMDFTKSVYDKDTFCYATKEHIEFGEEKLMLTYACNSMVLKKVVDNMELYRPRPIVVEIPK